MPYRVTIDHPNLGEQDLFIHGLGTFANGSTTEVSDEDMDRYRAMHSIVNISSPDRNGNVKHMPALGRHPVDLNIYGVRVERLGDDNSTGEEGKSE